MANIANVDVFTIIDPPIYSEITDYLVGGVTYSDCADKASEAVFRLHVPISDPNYFKIVNKDVLVENANIVFRLWASGEHYVKYGGAVYADYRQMLIKEVDYTYTTTGASLEIRAYDVTLDMKRIKNTFTWRFPNTLEVVKAMARRYGLEPIIKKEDADILEAEKLPTLQQTDQSDYDFLKSVLKTAGKKVMVSAAFDKLWLTTVDYKIPTDDALWEDMYHITYADDDNNKLLSATVSLERVDKKDSGTGQVGQSNIAEDGNIYQVNIDQKGQIRGGKYGVARFDKKTNKWVPDDITIEEAMNPTVVTAGTEPPTDPAKDANTKKKVEPVFLVESLYATTGYELFNYLTSTYFVQDTKLMAELLNTTITVEALKINTAKLNAAKRLSLFERVVERCQTSPTFYDDLQDSSVSAVGKGQVEVLVNTWTRGSQLYRQATKADYDQNADFALQEKLDISSPYQYDETTADRIQSRNFAVTSTINADSTLDVAKGDSLVVRPKTHLEMLTPGLAAKNAAEARVLAEIRKKRGETIVQQTAEQIAVATTGEVAQEQPDAVMPTGAMAKEALALKQQQEAIIALGQAFSSGRPEAVLGTVLTFKPTTTTLTVSTNQAINPNDPEKARRQLEADEDEKSKKSWNLKLELIFDPRYEPNNKVKFDGHINPMHNEVWWCTEVEHDTAMAKTVLTCIRDYDQSAAAPPSLVEELNAVEGETFITFDQYGNQKAVIVGQGGNKRYALLNTLQLLDGNTTLNRR